MKVKVLVLFFLLVPAFWLFTANPVLAAKKRVWKTTAVSTSGGSYKFSISAKLTGWKQYLTLSLKGLNSTTGVDYELIYNGSNTEQGVYGNIKASEGNAIRSIFLGTCSHGACVAHKNVSNLRLTVTYKTTTGQSVTKRYKVRY